MLASAVFTDADVFEDFIEQLLEPCNRWPAPKSVLIMDNASFHRTQKIQRMASAESHFRNAGMLSDKL